MTTSQRRSGFVTNVWIVPDVISPAIVSTEMSSASTTPRNATPYIPASTKKLTGSNIRTEAISYTRPMSRHMKWKPTEKTSRKARPSIMMAHATLRQRASMNVIPAIFRTFIAAPPTSRA